MFGVQYQQPYPGAMQPVPQMQPMQPQTFQNPYLERFNALTQPAMQPQPMQQLQRFDIIQVNGKNGAEAFRMAPNSRALLLDEKDPIVWLVTSDGAGYQTATPYTITPYQQPAPQGDLMDRLSRLEEAVYGKPNFTNAEPAAAGTGAAYAAGPAEPVAAPGSVPAVPAANGRKKSAGSN